MSLGKKEFTAFFKSLFFIIGPNGPTSNESAFLNDFIRQYMLNYYPSANAAVSATKGIDYSYMMITMLDFNETEKMVVKMTWAKLLKCNGNKMPSNDKIEAMLLIAEDTIIDMSDFTRYI